MEAGSIDYKLREEEHKSIVKMLKSRGRDLLHLLIKADEIREEQVGDIVTFVRNQNINFSNICYVGCKFCAFAAREGEKKAYRLTKTDIIAHIQKGKAYGVSEICATAGIDPKANLETYREFLRLVRRHNPSTHIHAFSPFEIKWLARKEGVSIEDVFRELRNEGLDSLCGTAAEILVDSVREKLCPNKLSTSEWIEIITIAHEMGIRTTSTIMYGHIETLHDVAEHLQILRRIQEETKGFTEFIPLPFVHYNTKIYNQGLARASSTGMEDLALLATSRIYLGDIIPNIQVSWVKTGVKFAQTGLAAGANDFGGTLLEERISNYAGSPHGTFLEEKEIVRLIREAGRIPARRNTLYQILEVYQ